MKNKGFTIVEVLAIFVILGIIATIAMTSINKIKVQYGLSAFEESAKGVIQAAQTYYAENEYEGFPEEGMMITDSRLKIKNKERYKSGVIVLNSVTGKFELQLLTDGDFCANGTLDDIQISTGTCETKESCFIFNSTTQTIEKYNFDDETCPSYIVIPDKINNVQVLHIGNNAFTDISGGFKCSTDGESLFREEDSSYIEQEGENCYLKLLMDNSFLETRLKSITLPSNIETIGTNAFAGSLLNQLNLSNNAKLTKIGAGAFMGNLKLKEVVLPNDSNITSIESYAFADSSLTEFDFQNLKELSKIGDGAFTNTLLREINLTNSEKITTIGKGAFYGITSNPTLELGNKSNIASVGDQAFCQTEFIYSGYTNINESLTNEELTNSCLANIIN